MSDDKLYSINKGREDGAYAGRSFASISGYMVTARAALVEAGAEVKGPGAYLLPEGKEEELIGKLDKLTVEDKAQALKDRMPVSAADAEKLKIGDEFDFGGEVGKKPIIGIGNAFTPKRESIHDDRLTVGEENVYVYNANAPKSAMPKPELTEEEKAERAKARAEQLAERDKTRFPIVADSVEKGGTMTVDGEDVTVTKLGKVWTLEDQDAVDALKTRFPDAEVEVGSSVRFASFEAPEPEEAPAP